MKSFAVLVALVFLAALIVAALGGRLRMEVLVLYLGAILLSFVLYAYDKLAARNNQQRIPENVLHLVSLLGGWPGALVAQQVFRHKTLKQPFRAAFWLTVVLNVGTLAWWFGSGGGGLFSVLSPEP